jgi:hypothetical protein
LYIVDVRPLLTALAVRCERESFMRLRPLLALVIPVLLGACTTWAVSPPPVGPVIEQHQGDHVQVKVAGRTAFDMHDIQTIGDSLIGTTGAGDRYAVALDDVEYVRLQETDTAKTGLLMGGVLVATLFVVIVVGSAAATASLAGQP